MFDLYDLFASDEKLEKEGILLNFGSARFLVAMAGGANKDFAKAFKEKSKPHRYAIDHNKLSDEDATQLLAEVYAETVILGWESVKKGKDGKPEVDKSGAPKLHKFIEDKEGKLMSFNQENCVKLLISLPKLFRAIQKMAQDEDNFIGDMEEEDLGNLEIS